MAWHKTIPKIYTVHCIHLGLPKKIWESCALICSKYGMLEKSEIFPKFLWEICVAHSIMFVIAQWTKKPKIVLPIYSKVSIMCTMFEGAHAAYHCD
jgi:hypothetical protein